MIKNQYKVKGVKRRNLNNLHEWYTRIDYFGNNCKKE